MYNNSEKTYYSIYILAKTWILERPNQLDVLDTLCVDPDTDFPLMMQQSKHTLLMSLPEK